MNNSGRYRVYIHFPFCLKKCHYCDFNSYACRPLEIPHEEYVGAMVQEIQLIPPLSRPSDTLPPMGGGKGEGEGLASIFFGGGTPSLMRPKDIERIFDALQKKCSFSSNIEITLEVNPGSVNPSKLAEFRAAGVNRFSIGVQSFDDVNLKWFGRIHTVEEGRQMIQAAQCLAGCRVGLDLIYGFPNQTVDDWKRNLEEAVALGVKHLSCYALSIDHDVHSSQFTVHSVNSDVAANMQETTYEFMKNAGLPAYEISNFAVPGEESRHNLGYWRYEDFWGLGAGAVSQTSIRAYACPPKLGERRRERTSIRRTNFKAPVDYMRAVMSGEKYYEEELIDEPTAQFEFMMMGLRTREGVSTDNFQHRFGELFEEKYRKAIDQAVQSGWLERRAIKYYGPTIDGFLFNNQLMGTFL